MKVNRVQLDVFMGPAGAGKDTLAKRLVREVPHSTRLSTGDICRGAKSGKGRYGYYQDEIDSQATLMENGGLINDDVAFHLTKQAAMKAYAFGTNRFFLTGFPRVLAQLEMFDKWRRELEEETGEVVESRFVYFDLDFALADDRRKSRIAEAIANGDQPRKDDQEEVFLRRTHEFKTHTEPLVLELARQGRIKNIHVNGSIDQNLCKIREALGLLHFPHPERR